MTTGPRYAFPPPPHKSKAGLSIIGLLLLFAANPTGAKHDLHTRLFRREWSLRQPRRGQPDFPTIAARLAYMDRLGIAAHGIDWELGRLLSLDVADEVLVPILGANMRRILTRRR
jgi:hypothetical protein